MGTLAQAGIDTGGIIVSEDCFTTLAFVTFDANGDRSFSFSRKPGADTLLQTDEIKFDMIKESRVFHFGTLSFTHEPARTAAQSAIEFAKKEGKLISFDPNLREPLWEDLGEAAKWMEWGIWQADIVKISDEEADFLWKLSPKEAADKLIRDYDVKLAFVTCGANGCVYMNRQARGSVPALAGVRAKDTTGAGDIFGGSALWKVLETGNNPEDLDDAQLQDIVKFACASAGLSTQKNGGISSIPLPKEVEAVL